MERRSGEHYYALLMSFISLANAPRVGQAKWDLYPEYELLIALLQPDYVRIISASAALSMKFFKDDDASWVHGFPSDDLLI